MIARPLPESSNVNIYSFDVGLGKTEKKTYMLANIIICFTVGGLLVKTNHNPGTINGEPQLPTKCQLCKVFHFSKSHNSIKNQLTPLILQTDHHLPPLMCDVIQIHLLLISFLGVSFPTSPLILFLYVFYDVTHDTF